MKLVLIDVYGDGGTLIAVEEQDALPRLLDEWRAQDAAYCKGKITVWKGLSDFLRSKEIEILEFTTVVL